MKKYPEQTKSIRSINSMLIWDQWDQLNLQVPGDRTKKLPVHSSVKLHSTGN